ncbi:MAG: hypothetical protein JRJ39_18045 [Deltaproteobacteria bacterium]|nr:hypothetical protein [Deltaproteobacteria bacterium]MBW1846053.1 hypothetical protein [Deltaproteobacteria bacterium]MBW2181635.1 hypothetical protein [Deltaproteobacteria bacterium]MBW2365595.1 hypothetical protein [Deltaproteobacteria bacterium]
MDSSRRTSRLLAGFLDIYLSTVTSFLREHWILEAVVSLKLLANKCKYCQTLYRGNQPGRLTVFYYSWICLDTVLSLSYDADQHKCRNEKFRLTNRRYIFMLSFIMI